MRPYNAQEIQDAFDKLPEQLKATISSPEIQDSIEVLSEKYNLHIDQIGELVDEIGLVLLNLHSSADFVTNVSQRLGISSKITLALSQDINKVIFDPIRNLLKSETIRNTQEESSSAISSLARVGGFSIDKPATEPERKPVTPADRNSILAGLENPPTSAPTPTDQVPANLPTSSTNSSNPVPRTLPAQPKQEESHVEPLVDYLLSNPVGQASKTVSPTRPTPAQQPKPRPAGTPDPYRESF